MTRADGYSLSGRQPKAVQRALMVLETVATSGSGVTAKEVAAALGMAPATTYRLLNILVAEGYLVRLPDLRGFALGHRIGGLLGVATQRTVCYAAHQTVAELRATIRFAIHLVLYSATAVRVVDADPDHPLLSEQGLNRYLHASAFGKLFLSEQAEWREIFAESRLVPITARTIISPVELDKQLGEIRASGMAQQFGELRLDNACLAVAIRSKPGELVGGLAVAGPPDRRDALLRLIEPLQDSARRLGPLVS